MVSIGVGRGGQNDGEAPAASVIAASAQAATAKADDRCPLTVEQVTAATGAPMTRTPGGCTFFPVNGRDIPHVFYVVQPAMVCTSIKPGDLGFTERVEGLPAQSAYVKDQLDGTHVLVCHNDKALAFDIVVNIKNDKSQNREAAVALAKQVLAGR
jgi:hypothetical protein